MILHTVLRNKIGFRKTSDIYTYGYYTAHVSFTCMYLRLDIETSGLFGSWDLCALY